MQTKKLTRPDKQLFAKGETGILTKLKKKAETKRFKQLIRTEEDGKEVCNLIKQLDDLESKIKSQGLHNRQALYKKHIAPLKGRIYYAIIRQGFISSKTMKRFKFKTQKLVISIAYRNLIEQFINEVFIKDDDDVFKGYLSTEADKGEFIDTYKLSEDFYNLLDALIESKQFIDDDLSKPVIDGHWLNLNTMANKEHIALYNKRAKIENLCYYIHFNEYSPIRPITKNFDSKRLWSLGTSSLEKIISFYCQKMNEYNKTEIEGQRKKIRRIQYKKKKDSTASEKRALVQLCKTQGMNQSHTVTFTTFSLRLVKSYWN